MTKREELEAEVRHITSPKAHTVIIDCPDGTEIKLHVRAISPLALERADEVIGKVAHGVLHGMLTVQKMGKAMESEEDLNQANLFSTELVRNLRENVMSFLPWFIESGTDITYDKIKDLDYLITIELVTEIIGFNFGTRLRDFIERASSIIAPLMKGGITSGLAVGPSPKASSLVEDTIMQPSETGA